MDLLNSLSIKNFALIEDVELQLQDGLTIITGETGAGKSILLGALSLLLGKRADLNSIKDPSKKCIIEGVFSVEEYHLKALFQENDLDYDPQTIIRREILPSGKSRAFVNDTPVRLKNLAALGSHLVDIHSQHETLFVGDSDYQYQVIDRLAKNQDLLENYQHQLHLLKSLHQQFETLQKEQQEAQKTYDYHLFLLHELQSGNFTIGMQEELEERQQELTHIEELKETFQYSLRYLQKEDLGIIDGLLDIKKRLDKLAGVGKNYQEISDRMKSIFLELEDLTTEMERQTDTIEDHPEALEEINEKLQNLYALQQKHGVDSVEGLLSIQNDLEEKVATAEHASENTEQLKKEIEACHKAAEKVAQELTDRRRKAVPYFLKSVKTALTDLGMPNAELKITFAPASTFTLHGRDHMNWLFSANKGGRLHDIKKSASGGELSRIALVIKSILADFSKLPTLIFDEIDTGVSGEIAQKMGEIMDKMGQHLQLISITHLPQIAAKGTHHFKVRKEIHSGKTQTLISELDTPERLRELAEMLGGKKPSESALAHAKTLLN